jgi:hypothetical protein
MACYGTRLFKQGLRTGTSFHFVVLAVVFSKPCAFGESGAISESSSMGPILI